MAGFLTVVGWRDITVDTYKHDCESELLALRKQKRF